LGKKVSVKTFEDVFNSTS